MTKADINSRYPLFDTYYTLNGKIFINNAPAHLLKEEEDINDD